jgi:hypothetical protein
MEFTVPDTLVLKIVEYEENTNKKDNTLYVLYDQSIQRYVIRGNRRELPNLAQCVHSFECKSVTKLADYIQFVIDRNNYVSYVLYNYDNLPETSNEVTFEFLSYNDEASYEIAGYDNKALKRRELIRNLRMLKNIFNYNN